MPVEDLRRRDLNNHITIGTVARMDYQKSMDVRKSCRTIS